VYNERLGHMRKMLSEHEKALTKFKDKEKESQKILADAKADRKTAEKANEKTQYFCFFLSWTLCFLPPSLNKAIFRQAKEEYDQMHETTMRQLDDLVTNKSVDFDSRYQLVRSTNGAFNCSLLIRT
jgi:hypothetical protein